MSDAPPGLPLIALPYWPCFQDAGARYGFDPLLIAAICSRETEFGTSKRLDKPGPTGRGDLERGVWYGHGLMQIDKRWHSEWLAKVDTNGAPLWMSPQENIGYAVKSVMLPDLKLLKDLHLMASAYNCGAGNVLRAEREMLLSNPTPTLAERWQAGDRFTSGGNYGSDVFARWERFRAVQ